jgi:hypothetical protein
MYRRMFHGLGLVSSAAILSAVLSATVIAVPAESAECPELELLAPDSGVRRQVAANMNGQQVVSSSGELGVGDPDGTGTVLLTLQDVSTKIAEVAFQLDTTNIAVPLEGAHIHKAPTGKTWVAAVTLFGFSGDADLSGVVTMSKCLAHDIFHRPGDFYVDVHNQEYPDQGALRGQLGSAR